MGGKPKGDLKILYIGYGERKLCEKQEQRQKKKKNIDFKIYIEQTKEKGHKHLFPSTHKSQRQDAISSTNELQEEHN